MKNNTKIFFKEDFGWKKINFQKKSIIYKGYLYNDSFLNILKKFS